MSSRRCRLAVATATGAAVLAACGGTEASASDTMTLYTCVSDTTIQPVIDAFEDANPDNQVELYRAPTGDLNARVAADVRSGALEADAIWACDPLTMQDYVDQGLVGGWVPSTDIAADYRTDDYVGVGVLYMLVVTGEDVPAPTTWTDLTRPVYDTLALPDPSFAASALGTLGYLAQAPDYGLEFYEALERNGAEQVSTPTDVATGVAEGVYDAGITIANSAYAAQQGGSPIEVVWPDPGAVAVYGPIALVRETDSAPLAKSFISYVTSEAGQRVISEAGSYPTLSGVPTPTMPDDAPVVFPDWSGLATQKDSLLRDYQQVLGR